MNYTKIISFIEVGQYALPTFPYDFALLQKYRLY
jgi:hypothetical protein